jgi:hypothetical protein
MTAESIAKALGGRKARVCQKKTLICGTGTESFASARHSGMVMTA